MRPIDADALIVSECSQCDGDCHCFNGQKCLECNSHNKCQLREAIDYADTIDAVPVVHARWIAEYRAICSACKTQFDDDMFWIQGEFITPNYCPNCGAKMDAKEGD